MASAEWVERAYELFYLAGTLGHEFYDDLREGLLGERTWEDHRPQFEAFCQTLLALRPVMEQPPEGMEPVAVQLRNGAELARQLQASLRHDLSAYEEYAPNFHSLSAQGYEALKLVCPPPSRPGSLSAFDFLDTLPPLPSEVKPAATAMTPPAVIPVTSPPDEVTPPAEPASAAVKGEGATVNARMLDRMLRDPEAKTWSSRQWADALGCAPSTIVNTPAWKQLAMLRAQAKAELALSRAKRRG